MVNHQSERLDAVFAALAHPARRDMLERLTVGPASVGDLAQPFDLSAPAISRHLRVLEGAGLVVRERDGRVHHIDMAGGMLAQALHWLDRNHRFWSTRLDRLAKLLEEPNPEEDPTWTPRDPQRPSLSRSSGRSPRRRSASSTRSRKRRH